MKALIIYIFICLLWNPLFAGNYSLKFDGTNDYVNIGNPSSGGFFDDNENQTISFWFKTSTSSGAWEIMFTNDTDANNPDMKIKITPSGYVALGATGISDITTSSAYNNGGWHHIVVVKTLANTYNGASGSWKCLELYVNASSIGKLCADGQAFGRDIDFFIGALRSDGSNAYNGLIDELIMWEDCALSASNIATLYNSGAGTDSYTLAQIKAIACNPSDVVRYYKANEGTGTTLVDSVNSNGSLQNGATWSVDANSAAVISGNSGFRMMSSPIAGTIYSDLLSELWIQGITGGDVTDGTANVWTLSGQSWSALTNLTSNSLTAGQGFLIYVFEDIDWDGDSDLPVTLKTAGTANTGDITIGSISDNDYYLAGNPYASTIDWDDVTKTNLSNSISVWDDANSDWKTWNGSSGDLTNGLIAPYQGFWIQASGGTGSFTIQEADISASSGTFYRQTDNIDSSGSIIIAGNTENYSATTYISFSPNGQVGLDLSDSKKLLPLQARPRICMMTVTDSTGMVINNLPFDFVGELSIPLDFMVLEIDSGYFNPIEEYANISWELENLPSHINPKILDNFTGTVFDLNNTNGYNFMSQEKDSFNSSPNGPIGQYPIIGNQHFNLILEYSSLNRNYDEVIASDYGLYPAYPNPFNPNTIIHFKIKERSLVKIDVYDMRGQLIENLINEVKAKGGHRYTWEPRNLSSGIYFLRLSSNNQNYTKKVSYVK